MNPFDLLNEELNNKKTNVKTATAKATATATKAKTTSATPSTPSTSSASATKPSTRELNANVNEKTPLRNNNRRSHNNNNSSNGNERQERRRTDRHSRSGYKQDGEKRLTSGKGSWGKAVEAGEEHVTVDESVAIAEQVEDLELENVADSSASASADAAVAEPVVPHLTLAQYQASLKKPALVSSNAPRKVNTVLPTDQIVKKETEVFVFPEIVKKSSKKTSTVKAAESTASSSAIDVTKYISVKAVSSVEPREPRSDREPRQQRGDRNNNRNSNNNNTNRKPNDRSARTSSTTPSTPKMNLKDDRSFPTLGSK